MTASPPPAAALPQEVAAAIDRCAGPALVFDLARIDARLLEIARAARSAQVTALFAVKSFPHAEVHALAAGRLAGFDVASPGEVEAVQRIADRASHVLSVADPSGRAAAAAASWPGRLIVSCETIAQVEAAPRHAELAFRMSASLTGRDPAVGAVLDGSGHRRSRFGLDVDPGRTARALAALARAAAGRPIGLHVHHGAVAATSSAGFLTTARAALAVADGAGITPSFLDLGGAWHAVADLPRALAELRAELPRALELLIEPGRRVAEGAGFACGRVELARPLDDRELRVLGLSRVCHLRWSQPTLLAPPPRTGHGERTLFAGPTCYEDDVLGEWTTEPAWYPPGAQVVFGNITGYAVAWNAGFGGLPPAAVVMVGAVPRAV